MEENVCKSTSDLRLKYIEILKHSIIKKLQLKMGKMLVNISPRR